MQKRCHLAKELQLTRAFEHDPHTVAKPQFDHARSDRESPGMQRIAVAHRLAAGGGHDQPGLFNHANHADRIARSILCGGSGSGGCCRRGLPSGNEPRGDPADDTPEHQDTRERSGNPPLLPPGSGCRLRRAG